MKIENNLVLCALMFLTSSSETKGQINALTTIVPPVTLQRKGVSTAYPLFPLVNGDGDPGPELNPTNQTTTHQVDGALTKPAVTHSDSLLQTRSVTAAGDRDDIRHDDVGVTSQLTNLAHRVNRGTTSQDNSTLTGTTQPPSRVITLIQTSVEPSTTALTPALTQPLTTEQTQTSDTAHVPSPADPPHREFPSELNVGDDDKGPPLPSPLDPLLASMVFVFVVTTAVVSIVLFLKLRKQTNHPEFHRLQDLPMDDLMEDTPLSRYTYSY